MEENSIISNEINNQSTSEKNKDIIEINNKENNRGNNLPDNFTSSTNKDFDLKTQEMFSEEKNEGNLPNADFVKEKSLETKSSISCNESGFKKFIKKYYDYLLLVSITIVVFIVALAVNGAKPFGNNSFLVSDTYEQIVEFFNHIFNVIEGKSSFFYSNYYGKGIEIFSSLEYMFLNPFYLVVLLGGRANIDFMFSLSLLLMLIFNGIIFLWFSHKHFPKIKKSVRLFLALFYVFSGYLNFSISFMTWLIYPALILIVIDRFVNFIKTGKIASFIVSLVWYVVSCYSVGISTVIILFILMTLYIVIMINKEERPSKMSGLFVVFLVTALCSLIILLPSIIAIMSTGRANSFIVNMLDVKDAEIYDKLAIFVFEAFIVILDIMYIIKCNKKDKFNKFLLFASILLFAPTFFDSVLRILCFSSYQGFCNRFFFLNEAILFIVTLKLFNDNLFTFKVCKSEKFSKIICCSLIALFVIVIGVLYVIYYYAFGRYVKSPLLGNYQYDKILVLITILLLGIFLVPLFFNWRKIFSEKAIKLCAIIVMALSFSINCLTFISASNKDLDQTTEISELVSNSNISGNIKIFNSTSIYLKYNYYLNSSRCPSVFTSLISVDTVNSFKNLGYMSGYVYTLSETGSLISDCLLGIKYYVTDVPQDRPYLKEIAKGETFYIYENTLSSSGAFNVNSDFVYDDNLSVIENMETLKESYGIEGTLFTEISFEPEIITDEEGDQKLNFKFTASTDGILYLNKLFYKMELADEENPDLYNIISENDVLQDLAYIEAGESYEFNIYWTNSTYNLDDIKCYFLNYEVAKNLCNKIIENQASFNYTSNGYVVNFTQSEGEKLIVTVPDIDGYNYFINGNEISVQNNFGSMVELSYIGENLELVVSYTYPHAKIWLLFSIIAIALDIIVLTLYHFTKFKYIQKLIYYLMKGVMFLLVIVVYSLGTLFSIVWFFAWLINL